MTPGDLLLQIDAYLSDEQQPLDERRAFWDILTAVRGPDRRRDRKALKHDVVGIIRAHAFPRTAKQLGKGRAGFRPKFTEGTLRDAAERLAERGGHYHTHAWRALLALAHWSPTLSRSEP